MRSQLIKLKKHIVDHEKAALAINEVVPRIIITSLGNKIVLEKNEDIEASLDKSLGIKRDSSYKTLHMFYDKALGDMKTCMNDPSRPP